MCQSVPGLNDGIALRKLKLSDAEPMLRCMRDPDIYRNMQYNPQEQTLASCCKFIENSWVDDRNFHYAVVNSDDRYMGTVSLKNIDRNNSNAEFAIMINPQVMRKGVGTEALYCIMQIAFEELGLHKVYLYVRHDNERAIAFYKKNRLEYEGYFKEHLCIQGEYKDIHWFSMRRKEYESWKKKPSG